MNIEIIGLHRVIIKQESTYLRFEATDWYWYDQNNDVFIRVQEAEHLEKEFQDSNF